MILWSWRGRSRLRSWRRLTMIQHSRATTAVIIPKSNGKLRLIIRGRQDSSRNWETCSRKRFSKPQLPWYRNKTSQSRLSEPSNRLPGIIITIQLRRYWVILLRRVWTLKHVSLNHLGEGLSIKTRTRRTRHLKMTSSLLGAATLTRFQTWLLKCFTMFQTLTTDFSTKSLKVLNSLPKSRWTISFPAG